MTPSTPLSAVPGRPGTPAPVNRWWQLLCGLVAMMAISRPQYVWALFTTPIQKALRCDLPALQVTISLLIVLQTFLSPFQGFLIERFGPRLLLGLGAVLTAASWVGAGFARDLTTLYLTYGVLGGLGTGIIYVGVVGLMVKWFPDRRGFAAGVAAAGYGMGAILTTFPIDATLRRSGYPAALQTYGVLFGLVGLAVALGLRSPPAGYAPAGRAAAPGGTVPRRSAPEVPPRLMLRHPIFWLLFVMMVPMSTGGLMVVLNVGAFPKAFGVDSTLVFGLAALPLALTVDRVTNGLTRPFFGWVSDRIGRERTMAVAFLLEAAAVTLLVSFRQDPLAFVLLTGLVFFGWGEIFSLFPSTLADTFGAVHATKNYGFLYVAQGIGSVLGGPLAAAVHDRCGSWLPVFSLVSFLDVLTALLALAVLRPWRARWLERAGTLAVVGPAGEGEGGAVPVTVGEVAPA